MRIDVAGVSIEGVDAEIAVGINCLPILRMRLSSDPGEQQSLSLAASNAAGAADSDGVRLPFLTLGFESISPPEDTKVKSKFVGLVASKNLLNWLAARPPKHPNHVTQIYQHGNASETAWQFLSRVLGGKFARPESSERFNPHFRPRCCVVRDADCDNLSHVHSVVKLLRLRTRFVQGWTGCLVNDGTPPLRLIHFTSDRGIELDSKWRISGGILPDRHAAFHVGCHIERDFVCNKSAFNVLEAVLAAGMPIANTADVEDANQAVALPGTVVIRGRHFLASSITWSTLPGGNNRVRARIALTDGQRFTDQEPFAGRFVDGAFSAWDERETRGRRETARLSSGGREWVMMDDQEEPVPDPHVPLLASVVTPFGGRAEYAGFYTRWTAADTLRILLPQGQEPIAVGQLQARADKWEAEAFPIALALDAPGIVMHGNDLTLLTSAPDTLGSTSAHALSLSETNQSIIAQAGNETRIFLNGKEQKIYAEKRVQISGALDIAGQGN
jgi:hypothetical protein